MGCRAAFVTIFLVLALLLFLFVNPLNLGVTTSSRFSWPGFNAIRRGMRIEKVIATLGEPLEADKETWQTGGETVRTYVFARADGVEWVVQTREAWVLVREDGTVAGTMTINEP